MGNAVQRLSFVLIAASALSVAPLETTFAQPRDIHAEIWRLELGTPVSELPPQYLDPHCATNGGPPSLRLDGWAEYSRCPLDAATGLHELWFTEDDEIEYVGLAYKTRGAEPGPGAANLFLQHKMIYSLLIDDQGFVQGYRAFTDPREPSSIRVDADFVGDGMRGLYGYTAFECQDLPPDEGETPIRGRFVKQICVAVVDGRHITIERHSFRKPGQTEVDPVLGNATDGAFDSSTRVEVIAVDLFRDAAAP